MSQSGVAVASYRSSSSVDALLAQFPGPIVLRPSRGAAIGEFVFGAYVFGLSVWFCATAQGDAWISAVVVVCGLLVAIPGALKLAGRDRLRLDREGFSDRTLTIERRYLWTSASEFASVAKPPFDRLLRLVAFSRATQSQAAFLKSRRLPVRDMIRLLERWRERALADARP